MAKQYDLDFRAVSSINAALSDEVDVSGAAQLSCNNDYCYTGQYPRHEGFMLETRSGHEMIASDRRNSDVVFPFLIGEEMLTDGRPQRCVIDFQGRSILEAQAYQLPFAHLQRSVLPHVQGLAEAERAKTGKQTGQDQNWLRSWWQHFRYRPELIQKITALRRYIVCSRVTKRPIFVFVSSAIRPGDALSCFAFSDDYSFGILQSALHWEWFVANCSKLTERFRYTPESVFDTFPWPQAPTRAQIDAVAAAGREIRAIRTVAMATTQGGLRSIYRTLELPGANPMRDAHVALDEAVRTAYGFGRRGDPLTDLLALNRKVASTFQLARRPTGPGIPPGYRNPERLVTKDCLGV